MTSIVKIPKSKILPVLNEIFSGEGQKRLNKLADNFLPFDKVIPVEKDPDLDRYYVVGRYSTFITYYRDRGVCILHNRRIHR